jgi:hypothetical protein
MASPRFLLYTSVAFLSVLGATSAPRDAAPLRCTMMPGTSRLLLQVRSDTTLPFGEMSRNAMSYSSVRPGSADTLLAVPGTPMPAARVRLLQLDSVTRATLAAAGIQDAQPLAFIRAAPYRADCRTIRWVDSMPWVLAGDSGYARASLAPTEQWIAGTPVFVIADAWNYPYPRQRGLAPFGTPPQQTLAPADALYDLVSTLEPGAAVARSDVFVTTDSSRYARALSWAKANPRTNELEPIRTILRGAIVGFDREAVRQIPSRLRGTYRVVMHVDGDSAAWTFRTVDKPAYAWQDADTVRSTASIVALPYAAGYQLVGYAATDAGEVPVRRPADMRAAQLVWLAAADQPLRAGNDTSRTLTAELQFRRSAAPPLAWDALDAFVRPPSAMDRALQERTGRTITREDQQPQLPITLRLGSAGQIAADTSYQVGGRPFRVTLVRVDTISIRRPF